MKKVITLIVSGIILISASATIIGYISTTDTKIAQSDFEGFIGASIPLAAFGIIAIYLAISSIKEAKRQSTEQTSKVVQMQEEFMLAEA